MTRLDDLLRTLRDRGQGLEVSPPSYDALHARGVRRRHRRRAAVVVGAAVLAASVVVGGQAVVGGPDVGTLPGPAVLPGPLPTAPAPTPVPPQGTDHDVPSPDPVLHTLVVAPGDEDVRAALWQRCARRCEGGRWELLLTRDGYATSTSVFVTGAWAPVVTAVGGDVFHVAKEGDSFVARVDGSTTQVRVGGDPGPLGTGEAFVRAASWGGEPLGLDPATGAAHPLAVPDDHVNLVLQPDGTLFGWTWSRARGARAVWSSDSGRTWQERVIVAQGSSLLQILPSARPGTLALVEGGDGATLFPMERLHRSTDGGATWQTFDLSDDPRAYVGVGGVMADGRLVVDVTGWSDRTSPPGIHVSGGEDWSRLTLARAHQEELHQQVWMDATEEGLLVSMITDGVGVVDVSRDGGERWSRLIAR